MFEIRKLGRQIPASQKETPACEAGESANNRGMGAIVAGRAPCLGIVPRNFDLHLAALAEPRAGVDVDHAENEREHQACALSVRRVVGAAMPGEVQS